MRLALSPDGHVLPDVRAKAPGRGAWIGVTRAELETASAKGKLKGALARAFKTGPVLIPDDLPALIESALERAALDRLGLESRSGGLLIGTERIETAARSGKLHLLLHAVRCGRGRQPQARPGLARRQGRGRQRAQGLGAAGVTHHIGRGTRPAECGTCRPD